MHGPQGLIEGLLAIPIRIELLFGGLGDLSVTNQTTYFNSTIIITLNVTKPCMYNKTSHIQKNQWKLCLFKNLAINIVLMKNSCLQKFTCKI